MSLIDTHITEAGTLYVSEFYPQLVNVNRLFFPFLYSLVSACSLCLKYSKDDQQEMYAKYIYIFTLNRNGFL